MAVEVVMTLLLRAVPWRFGAVVCWRPDVTTALPPYG